jgi:ATP/ADP translocase
MYIYILTYVWSAIVLTLIWGTQAIHLTDLNGAFRMSAILCSNFITLQQRGEMSIDVSDGTN